MRPSKLDTLIIPDITTKSPATLAHASETPLRVLVRNVGGNDIFMAHNTNELTQAGLVSGVYQLPAGQEDVIVLAPKQAIYASGQGAAGRVSVAISEVIPPQMES